jgi:replicative DNA helicase
MSNEAEINIIGNMVRDSKQLIEVDLKPDDFLNHNHALLWEGLLNMQASNQFIDTTTFFDYITKHHPENTIIFDILVEILNSYFSASNSDIYANVIRRDSLSAELTAMGQEIALIGESYGDFDEKLGKAQNLINKFNEKGDSKEVGINEELGSYLDELQRRMDNKGIDGLSTGFNDLDARFYGFKPADLVILAGRPAMGKTTLAINIADHNAMIGKNVLVFSMEMPRQQLLDKSLASLSKIHLQRLKTGDLQEEHWSTLTLAMSQMKDKKRFIDDSGYQTVQTITVKCKRHQIKHGFIDLVVIDYLQLISSKSKEGRTNQITEISRGLKLLAKELGCPVIALSQLNRGLEARKDKRPLMSDLRESGAIEQDADIIGFIYRDEVYYPDGFNNKGVAEFNTAKFRNGETGSDLLSSQLHLSRFDNLLPNTNYEPHKEQSNSGGFNG